MFLDSDDSLEKGAIEALMTKAEQSGADMVEGGFRQFDDAGNTIYTQIYEPREHLPSLNGFPWGKVIRSEMFKNLQFPENYWYETLFFLLMFDMAKNIARIDNSIYHYRFKLRRNHQSSRLGKVKSLDSFYITRRLMRDRKEMQLPITPFCYEKFLRQLNVNFVRTLRLRPIRKLSLCLVCDYL